MLCEKNTVFYQFFFSLPLSQIFLRLMHLNHLEMLCRKYHRKCVVFNVNKLPKIAMKYITVKNKFDVQNMC